MIANDQLTREERIRLEALSQANSTVLGRADYQIVLIVAQFYEGYIRSGRNLTDSTLNKQ